MRKPEPIQLPPGIMPVKSLRELYGDADARMAERLTEQAKAKRGFKRDVVSGKFKRK